MPLVSVIISTYNSSTFIIETFESIYNQSWQDIELIITDDHSTDDTIEVCHRWLKNKGNRFNRIQLIPSATNTGVSGNANRGLKKATGEWIKFLGADDTLLPDCLTDNINYVSENPDTKVFFSRVNLYKDKFLSGNFLGTTPEGAITSDSIMWHERSPESQYNMLLQSDRIHFSPSLFINRDTLIAVGGFDERFKYMEDYPLWLNLTSRGIRLDFNNKVTVNYRVHSKAINNTGKKYLLSPNYFRTEDFRKLYIYPYLPVSERLGQKFNWLVSHLFHIDCLNRDNAPNRFLFNLLTVYCNPFRLYSWLKSRS